MKSLAVWSLVAVNVVLGMALLARFGKENTAVAQVGRTADYLMIPGQVSGQSNAYLFVVDATNGQLGGLSFDSSTNRFDLLQPIDLNRLFDQVNTNQPPVGPARVNPRR